MKNIIANILLFGLVAVGCTDIEPLEMVVNSTPKDLAAIKEFKESSHGVSMVWFSNWKADGNMGTYLNTLPDSLDIVILENIPEEITPAMKTDIETVRSVKSTKVLMSVDMDKLFEEYQSALEEADSEGESIAEEKAAEEEREVTIEEIEAAVKIEQQKVMDTYSARIDEIFSSTDADIVKNGLDGLSIRASVQGDLFFRNLVRRFISGIGAKYGNKAGNGLFVFEGNIGYVNDNVQLFNYIISTTHGKDNLADVQSVFNSLSVMDGFTSIQFVCYLSIENDNWKVPYADIISSEEVTTTKNKSLAQWGPNSGEPVGGIAIKGIEADYESNYQILRQTIQYINLK